MPRTPKALLDGAARWPWPAGHKPSGRALRDHGYRVIELKTTDDLRPQLARHGDVFQQS
jgi:hypothetical protein